MHIPRFMLSAALLIGSTWEVGLMPPALATEQTGQSGQPGLRYDEEVTVASHDPAPSVGYEGRWSGTWRDRDGRTFSGDYEGRFEGRASGSPGVNFDPPPYAAAPQPMVRTTGPCEPVVTTTQAPGTYANGYYYPGATTTTIVIQPSTTTSGR